MKMKNTIQVITLIFTLLGLAKTASAVSLECMDFESYTPGIAHPVGTTLTYNDIFGELVAFQWNNGTWTSDGAGTVVNSNHANGSGQEANLDNINIRYNFDTDQPFIVVLRYADYGGNINLGVNGFFHNTNDLSDLNGMNIGGAWVIVSRQNEGMSSNHHGTVTLVGSIERFAIGGQEFWVDDVCGLFD